MRRRTAGVVLATIWSLIAAMWNGGSGAVSAFFVSWLMTWLDLGFDLAGSPQQGIEYFKWVFMIIGGLLMLTGVGLLVIFWGLLEGEKPWARTWGAALFGFSAFAKSLMAITPLIASGGLLLPWVAVLGLPTAIDLMVMTLLLMNRDVRQWCDAYREPPIQPPLPRVPERPSQIPVDRTQLFDRQAPATAWLMPRGHGQTSPFPLEAGRVQLGRDGNQCSIVLDDGQVSGLHATIIHENGRYYLYDLASTNGTYVNGKRVGERRMLLDGDELRLGGTVMVFKGV